MGVDMGVIIFLPGFHPTLHLALVRWIAGRKVRRKCKCGLTPSCWWWWVVTNGHGHGGHARSTNDNEDSQDGRGNECMVLSLSVAVSSEKWPCE